MVQDNDPTRSTTYSSSPITFPSPSSHRSASSPGLLRRQLTQERINDILEGARGRAESLEATSPPGNRTFRMDPLLPSRSATSLGRPSRKTSDIIQEQDDSTDESTNIVRRATDRRPGMNYQSMQTRTSSEQRARRSSARPNNGNAQRSPPPDSTLTQDDSQGGDGTNNTPGTFDGVADRRPKAQPKNPWWKKFLAKFQSIELENKGSVARDHLALERTFLAWLRTSLAFASIGIAITQLFRLNTSLASNSENDHLRRLGKPLGATFLGISICILFLGYRRYFQSQQWVLKGKFPASRCTIVLVSLIAFGVMIASLVVVIVVQPDTT